MPLEWTPLLLIVGISFALWMAVGGLRLSSEVVGRWRAAPTGPVDAHGRLSPADVAILVPAHNEEVGIGATLDSALRVVPAENIHVVADGCNDATASIARGFGVNVIELTPAMGKAGGIRAAVEHFDLPRNFELLLILDADTEIDQHYLVRGLRMMDDPEMVALAGYARASWQPAQLGIVGRFLVSYRTRLYAVMQWMKFGQTWRYTNLTPIVPGFASMYRTSVLPKMDLNPPGLVIEDFNMTFEIHRKRLGKIAFRPSVFGTTQDPDNLADYYRQICRWWLGLWQTVRLHKVWFSWFSAALVLFLVEVILASIVLLSVGLAITFLALDTISGGQIVQWPWYAAVRDPLASLLTPLNLLLFLFIPDYVLTVAVALWLRRPSLLLYGTVFTFIRLLDASATVWTLVRNWGERSNGQWSSPARRPIVHAAPSTGAGPAPNLLPHDAAAPPEALTGGGPRRRDGLMAILADGVLLAGVLALAAVLVSSLAVSVTVVLMVAVVTLAIGAVSSNRRRRREAPVATDSSGSVAE